SVALEQTAPSCFSATTRLAFGERVDYKFVVDGQWQHSHSQQHEWDASGNLNNVLHVPPLALPPAEAQGSATLNRREEVEAWRSVRIGHWDGEKTRLLAALYPSATLTFQTLRRTVLPRLVDLPRLPGRGYRFAQGRELVEEGEQSRQPVAAGDYTLVSPGPSLPSPSGGPLPLTDTFATCVDPIPALSLLPLPPPLPHPEPASAAFTPQPSASGFFFSPRLPAPPSEPDLLEHVHNDEEQHDAGERTLRHTPSLGSLASAGSRASAEGFEDARSFSSHSRTPSLVVSADDDDDGDDHDEWEAQSDATFSTALSAVSYSHWFANPLHGGRGARGGGGPESEPLPGREDSDAGVPLVPAALPVSRAVSRGAVSLSGAPLMAREEHTVVAPLPESLDEPLWTPCSAGDHEVAVEKVEEVARAFRRGEWVLDPGNGFEPLALHPDAQGLLPFIRPAPALLASASPDALTPLDFKADDDGDAPMTTASDEQYLPTPPASPLGLHSTVPLAPAATTTAALKIHPSHRHHDPDPAAAEAAPDATRQDKLRERAEHHLGGAIARWVVVPL
ncbi:hypothetical protein JCM21900_002812, partial [Sporobolomyces salmonicolor]